ncbi:nitroreductase A [Salmonella enterica]|uniref:Nitroreductase A n=2 Tax=Salmonella enterica TaxID=28901 RepID=A0A7D8INM9_SALER|nr:nitroreductase A [Salmonella enterica]
MSPTIELLCGHRSIRHFTDEPVTDAQREAIIAAARSTSSSSFFTVQLYYPYYRSGAARGVSAPDGRAKACGAGR